MASINSLQAVNYVTFIVLLIFYEIVIIFTDIDKDIVALALFVVFFFIQIGISFSMSKIVKPEKDTLYHVKQGLKASVPVIVMLGSIYVILMMFPGWLSVFSNTLGLAYIKMFGITRLLNGTKNEPGLLNIDKESRFINMIYGNNMNFLNNYAPDNIFDTESHYETLLKLFQSGIFNPKILQGNLSINAIKSNDRAKEFTSLMKQKYYFSELMWLLLIGLGFSVSTSILMIVNSSE